MEETVNKKSILVLFFSLIILFMFLYHGLVRTNDSYLKEYSQFKNKTLSTSNTKKIKNNQKNKAKDDIKTVLTNVLGNLENIHLELSAFNNDIMNKQQQSTLLLSLLKNYTDISNDTIKTIFEKFDRTKLSNSTIDKLTENIELNMNILKNYTNHK